MLFGLFGPGSKSKLYSFPAQHMYSLKHLCRIPHSLIIENHHVLSPTGQAQGLSGIPHCKRKRGGVFTRSAWRMHLGRHTLLFPNIELRHDEKCEESFLRQDTGELPLCVFGIIFGPCEALT